MRRCWRAVKSVNTPSTRYRQILGSDSESSASCPWSSGGATARATADGGTYRHDGIRAALWNALKHITGVLATLEPRVTTPHGPGDQRRADIKVHLDGTTWLVDVGVVCPGTPRLLAMGTDPTPGRAAAV